MLIFFLKLNQVVKLKLYDGYNVDKFFFFILSSGRSMSNKVEDLFRNVQFGEFWRETSFGYFPLNQ